MKNKKIFFAGLAIVILAAALGMYFVYAGPGTVTNTWDFTAPANYEYDHAKVEVSGGKAQLRKAVHTQEDATFAGGTGTDAAVDADGVVQLVSGQASGTYTSRIFDAGESVTWEKLKAKVIYPHPIEPDCSDAVACWHFDESSWNGTTGEVIDATGVNNGTAKNGAHPTTVAISGNAGHFDGKNDYVDCGNDESLNITDAITVEAWVKPVLDSDFRYIVAHDMWYHWGMRKENNNKVYCHMRYSDGSRCQSLYIPALTAEWQHIAFTWNKTVASSNAKAYKNGVLVDVATCGVGLDLHATGRDLSIGSNYGYDRFNGTIDEVRIYNRALSAEEILAHYKQESPTRATEVKFQARACDDAACDGESFVGPDGTADTFYSADEMGAALSGQTGQYFQYRATLSTEDTAYTPKLDRVELVYTGDYIIDGDYIKGMDEDKFGTDGVDNVVYANTEPADGNSIELIGDALLGSESLVGSWHFDEVASGQTPDTSRKGNTGTLGSSEVGDAAEPTLTTGGGGKFGEALIFDGVDDYVDVGDLSESGVKTVEFWVKADDITDHTDYVIDLNGTDYITIVNGEVTVNNIASPTYYVDSTSGEQTIPDITNWHYVAVTTATGINASDLDIGRLESTGFFKGTIDEVRIYNRALTPNEIAQHYAAASVKYAPASGEYVSAVLQPEDPAIDVDWYKLSWDEDGEYGEISEFDDDGAVGIWHFDTDDSTAQGVTDSSGYGNNGTRGADDQAGDDDPTRVNTGKFGSTTYNALSFDGENDYVEVPDSPSLDITDEITIEAWVKIGAFFPDRTYVFAVGKATASYGFWLGLSTYVDKFIFRMFTPSDNGMVLSINTPNIDEWYHIVGLRDGNNDIKLYVNGIYQGKENVVGDFSVDSDLKIGENPWGDYFNGTIDEVRIYNRALSAKEVREHYLRGLRKLKFKVRGCADDTCSTDPDFVGPLGIAKGADGYDDDWFVKSGTVIPAGIGDSPYIQYKAAMSTELADIYSPKLNAVYIDYKRYAKDNPWIAAKNYFDYNTLGTFSETLGAGNAGSVGYQIRYDEGGLWYYYDNGWTGTSDVSGDSTNTATEISEHLSAFSKPGKFSFRAFLKSDGTQAVELDKVQLVDAEQWKVVDDDPDTAETTEDYIKVYLDSGSGYALYAGETVKIGDKLKVVWDNSGSGNNIAITSASVDFSQLGGSAAAVMYDDGANGDAVSGDGKYTAEWTTTETFYYTVGAPAKISITALGANDLTSTCEATEIKADLESPYAGVDMDNNYYSSSTWSSTAGSCSIKGDASDAGGIDTIEVCIKREDGDTDHYWNGADWTSTAETWNSATITAGGGVSDTWAKWEYSLAVGELTADKTYTVKARATDKNDNTTSSPGSDSFVYIGVEGTDLTITASPTTLKLGGSSEISGTISSEYTGKINLLYSKDAGAWTAITSVEPSAGAYSYFWFPQAAGDYNLKAVLADQAEIYKICGQVVTVSSADITLAPEAGDWYPHQSKDITWTISGEVTSPYKLEYAPDGTSFTTIAENVERQGLDYPEGSAWTKYRKITINNTGEPLANYQLKVDLTDLTGLTADEIRFSDADGAALNYFTEAFPAKVWVKVPYIPTGTKEIYLYYGNTDAKSASNYDNAMTKNFEGGISTDGLVGYWRMNEASWDGTTGEVIDASGSGNNGTAAGGLTTTADGKLGRAGSFDGGNDYIEIPHSESLNITDAITIEAWVKVCGYTGPGWNAVLSDVSYPQTSGYELYVHDNGKPRFSVFVDGEKTPVDAVTSISLNSWHHLVGTYDGSNLKIYINGEEDNSISAPGSITPSGWNLWIGGWHNTDWFNGAIDEVRIYNRALSAEEIKEHYDIGKGLVALWHFDAGSGATAIDSSGQGNDGTFDLAPQQVTGKVGNALSFDGSNDYVEVPDSPSLDITDEITIEAWVKINPSSGYRWIARTSSHAYFLGLYGNDYLTLSINNKHYADGGVSITENQWHHVVGTYDRVKIRLYIDGELKNDATEMSEAIRKSGTLYIGQAGWNAQYFNGAIDEVRIYNRVLTAEEIAASYNAGLQGIRTNVGKENLVGYWSMDNASGAVVTDESGNSNTGTAYGGCRWASEDGGKFGDTDQTFSTGSALEFDGRTGYVDCGNDESLDITDEITIEAWVKPNEEQNNAAIVAKYWNYTGHSNKRSWEITTYSDFIKFAITSDGTANTIHAIHSNVNPSPNNWYHIVAVFKSSTYMRLYINGVLDAEKTSGVHNSIFSSNEIISMGVDYNFSHNFFKGTIDEVRIYNRALSPEEIKAHYERRKYDFNSDTTVGAIDSVEQVPSSSATYVWGDIPFIKDELSADNDLLADNFKLRITSANSITADSDALSIHTPQLKFTQEPPKTAKAGEPFTPTVTVAVQTQAGATITGDSETEVTLTAQGADDQYLKEKVTTVAGGVASFGSLSYEKSGERLTLKATGVGNSVCEPVSECKETESSEVYIIPADASKIGVSGITDPIGIDTVSGMTVQILDSEDNIATNFSGTVNFSGDDALFDLDGDTTFSTCAAGEPAADCQFNFGDWTDEAWSEARPEFELGTLTNLELTNASEPSGIRLKGNYAAAADLAGAWLMEGAWSNVSGEGNDLTVQGSVPASTDRRQGFKSAEFDGSSGLFISSPGTSLQPGAKQSLTVSLWVKPKDIGNSHTQRLVTLGTDAGGGNKYWEFSINGLDKAMFTVYDSAGSPFSIQSDSKLLVDAWYHLTGVYDYGDGTNGQMRLYVNGASGADPVSCTGGIKIWDGGAKFTVGFKDDGTADGAEHFTGLLDEVSVWNKALTAPQVSTLYNQSLAAVTGYVSSGTYISALKDVGAAIALGTNLKWGNISWIAELPGSDTVKFQIASDNDAVPTDYIGPQGSVNDYYSSTQNVDSWGQSVHNTHRFLKYKAVLSGSGATTPILSAVDIAYSCLYGLVGQKTFTNAVKFSAAGNKTVTATATGLTDGAQTVSVQKPDYFTITSDGTGIAGASENFTVTAYMRVGEDSVKVQVYKGAKQIEMRVANYPAGFAAPKYNGTEISTTADWTSFNVEFAAGEATLPITFYGAGDGISVLVKATDITEGSASINISNAAANKIEFSGDIGEQIAGAGFNLPVLKVLDEYGNLCADYTYSGTGAKTVTYTLSGDSHVSDSWTTSVEFSQGLSTTVLATTLCKAQSTTITAEISPLTADTSNQFEVKPADPASIELTQQPDSPHYVMAPLSPAPIVTIKDVYGNTCTNAAGNVSITADPAHLEGTASVALSNGVATFTDLKYTQLTTAVLTADYSDLTPVDFDPITFIVAGEAVLTVDGITQSSTILSSKNTFAERSEVFKFKVTDGGVDLLPVKVTKLVINRGASDTDDWTNYIPAGKAYLYIEDASGNKVKELTGGIVTADKITFGDTTYELFSVPNGGERTISLKIYLKNSLPANADGKQFYFETSCSDISLDSMGSSFGEATTTVHNDPYLDVKASKFIIRKADDGASEISITAGTPVNIKINAVDENGNIDKTGFTGIKEIYFSGAQVSPAPASKSPTCSGIDFGLPTSIAFVDGEAASVEMIIYNAAVSYIKAYTEAIPLENSLSGDALRAAVSAGPGVALAWDKPFWDEQTDAESASITAVLISKAVWPVFEVKIIDDYGNTDVNAAETTIAVSSTLCSGTSGAVTSAGIANFDDFAVDCGGVVSTTLNLNATGGDFTPVQSNDIIVKEKYGIELKILDSTTGTKLSGVNLSVFTANMQGVSVSISGANPFTFELPYKSGGYIFQTSKDAYVDATVSQTTDSQTDGKDGTYDGQISSIAFMTSILEAKSDYHVLGDFVYDEDTDTLSIYVRLEKKGKQIKSDVVNMLKGVTLEIVDPALSGAGRTIESLSKGITELVNKGKGDYWFEIKNAVGSGKFKSGKVYLANMAITYGPRSKDYPGDLTDEEKAGLGLSEADIEDMGLNVLYTAADTFEIGVAARLKVWTGEIREEVAGVKETVSLEAGVTRGKIEDVKSDVSGLKGAVATEAETTREKVADVHTEAVSILEDTATTIPAFLTTIEQKVGAQILNRETSVKSGETITIRYRTDSGLSPEIDVYDANNVQRVTDGTMTEIDSTGVYEYDVKFLSRWGKGDYTIVCSESTQGTVDSMTLSVLSADIESVSQDVSATLAMKDTSALEDRISALESRVNQILGRLTGKIGGGISVERRVVEVVTKPIYTEIKTISKALKEIGASEEYGLKPIYEVSEKSAEDVVYLKNKTLELKAVADVTRELVGRLNDKPIVRTWMEIAK